MKKTIVGAISGAFAVCALAGAGVAQAAPFDYIDNPSPFDILQDDGTILDTNPSPWDFANDSIELPFGGRLQIVNYDGDFGPGFQGHKGSRGADRSGPRSAGAPG
ncbi:hypothetical protein [Mycobacterium sp. C31M]